MKEKTKIIVFLVLSALVIGSVPIINHLRNNTKSNTDYFNTDYFEGRLNYFFYKVFAKSLVPEKVVVGKDDFLFLGNSYARVLSKSQNLIQKQISETEKVVASLKKLQQWYEQRNIKFLTVVIPNKHTVYESKLPYWAKYQKDSQNLTNAFIDKAREMDIHLLDLRNAMLKAEKKYSKNIYYVTDSHWNMYGAGIGYEETMRALNDVYNQKYKTQTYKVLTQPSEGKGSIRLLKANTFKTFGIDETTIYEFEEDKIICIGEIKQNPLELAKCVEKSNYVFNIHRGSKYFISDGALNSESLLLMGDSFTMQNSKLFDRTFQTIWKFHYNEFSGDDLFDFVNDKKPDIVIYQIVERALYDNYFLDTGLSKK